MKVLTIALLALLAATSHAQTTITLHDDRSASDVAITLPQGLTRSTDSLLSSWAMRHYLQGDTVTAVSVSRTFPAEVYQERLRRLPTIIDMPYNGIVRHFIDDMTTHQQRRMAYWIGAGNFYIPIFEEALDYYGLPLELKYLPAVASGLDPATKGAAGRTGLWQFTLETAQQYGLSVNSLVDERRDAVKASWAAARLLRELYGKYADWNLTLAAYACGEEEVDKAMLRADGAKDYWTIFPHLPVEARGYVPAFVAANYVMAYYCEHNIAPLRAVRPAPTDTVMLSRDLNMRQVADLCAIDVEAVRSLNPQYRTDIIPGRSGQCALRLPKETLATFIGWKDSIYNYKADELLVRRATIPVAVAPTPAQSQASRQSSRQTSSSSRSSRQSSRARTVTVRRGDTLSGIAARNGISVSRLRQLNGLRGNMIKPGQRLRVR